MQDAGADSARRHPGAPVRCRDGGRDARAERGSEHLPVEGTEGAHPVGGPSDPFVPARPSAEDDVDGDCFFASLGPDRARRVSRRADPDRIGHSGSRRRWQRSGADDRRRRGFIRGVRARGVVDGPLARAAHPARRVDGRRRGGHLYAARRRRAILPADCAADAFHLLRGTRAQDRRRGDRRMARTTFRGIRSDSRPRRLDATLLRVARIIARVPLVSLSPGTRIGPYEVLALLGAGGMGEVYRARDTKLNRDVAVKVLAEVVATDPDRLARFRREAQVLASLNHPNIAHVYGVEDASSIHGLVMELVEGPTLADRIAQGLIPLDDALSIARQITEALEAAHEQGIIHRDLKPANIKVRNDGTVKVLDFGLAKLADSTSSDVNVTASPTLSRHATMAGVILGTAAYMSPEQARGKAVDKRADIWAFGCVLFEMVTGRRAFGGDDVTETFAAIVRDQPNLSEAPAQLRRLLARCFEKDPRRRLRDIGDVWTLLDDDGQAQEQSVRLKPDATLNARATTTTLAWRRAPPWVAAAAAAIAAAGVSVVHLTETRFVPRTVRFQLQVPEEAGSVTPALSPDGTRLAYRFGGQIWVRDLGSLESRAIAPTDRPIGRLFWSADSRFVVYAATGKLMRVPAAGGVPETVGDQPLILGGGFGLADGGIVVSSASPLTDGGDTQRIDKTGAHALSSVRLDLRGGASLLPDGRRFVYSVFEPEARRGVYVASIDSAGAPERILPDASDVAYVPSVKRGNEGYLLVQRQDALVAVPVDAAGLQARGEPIVLAKGVGGFAAAAGDSLVYRAAASRRLTWYDRKGTSAGTAWSPGAFSELALSPDGTRVVVVRTDGRPATWVHEFARESSA